MPDTSASPEAKLFTFLNEIGILAQLSRALFEARLPLGFTVPQFSVLNNLVRVRDGRSPGELAMSEYQACRR